MSKRPAQWNDDVRWLLARIAGLAPNDGRGTDTDTLPVGISNSVVSHYIRADHINQTSSSEIVLQLPVGGSRTWRMLSVALHQSSGSAPKHAGLVGQVAGFTADGPDDRLGLGSVNVANPISEVFLQPISFKADSNYRLYFRPQYSSGTNNAGTHQFWFIQDYETDTSS